MKKIKKNSPFSDIYCPFCGHFVMKQYLREGYVEVKCRHCKNIIKVTKDNRTLAVILSLQRNQQNIKAIKTT